MLLEISLILIKKTIQPRKKLLGAVIGVQDDWDTVYGGHGADEESTGNTTSDRSLLLAVANTLVVQCQNFCIVLWEMDDMYLSSEVGGTALGHL